MERKQEGHHGTSDSFSSTAFTHLECWNFNLGSKEATHRELTAPKNDSVLHKVSRDEFCIKPPGPSEIVKLLGVNLCLTARKAFFCITYTGAGEIGTSSACLLLLAPQRVFGCVNVPESSKGMRKLTMIPS